MVREDEYELSVIYDMIRYHSKQIEKLLKEAEQIYSKEQYPMTFEQALEKVRNDEKKANTSVWGD